MTENALPAQLKWGDFVRVVKKLGYEACKPKGGSARNFKNCQLSPPIVTFHEPHGSDPVRKGTLREYIRKLGITKERFLELLNE
ncbi:MAG: type II toxin-antitoxin system HicA family toxin [Candidatus Acidiferrales bacterium]